MKPAVFSFLPFSRKRIIFSVFSLQTFSSENFISFVRSHISFLFSQTLIIRLAYRSLPRAERFMKEMVETASYVSRPQRILIVFLAVLSSFPLRSLFRVNPSISIDPCLLQPLHVSLSCAQVPSPGTVRYLATRRRVLAERAEKEKDGENASTLEATTPTQAPAPN